MLKTPRRNTIASNNLLGCGLSTSIQFNKGDAPNSVLSEKKKINNYSLKERHMGKMTPFLRTEPQKENDMECKIFVDDEPTEMTPRI